MNESRDIQNARSHLNKVDMLNKDTEHHIDEGFLALEDIANGSSTNKSTAENLGQTYMEKFYSTARERLSEKHIPEPELKSLLRTVSALENTTFAGKRNIESLRMEIASRLVDSYFQGYTSTERSEIIRKLMERMD